MSGSPLFQDQCEQCFHSLKRSSFYSEEDPSTAGAPSNTVGFSRSPGLKSLCLSLTYFSLDMQFSESVRSQSLTWVKRKSLVKTGESMLGTKPGTKPMLCKGEKNPEQHNKMDKPQAKHTHTAHPTCSCHTALMSPASDSDTATTALSCAHHQDITSTTPAHLNNPPVLLFTQINIKSAHSGYLFNNSQPEK